jgi:hypothetical protein
MILNNTNIGEHASITFGSAGRLVDDRISKDPKITTMIARRERTHAFSDLTVASIVSASATIVLYY